MYLCTRGFEFLCFFYLILKLSDNVVFLFSHFIIPTQPLSNIEFEIMRKILFMITMFCQHKEGTSRYRNWNYFISTAVYVK